MKNIFQYFLTAILFLSIPVYSQTLSISDVEIEKRNAAAAFAEAWQLTLVLVQRECRSPITDSRGSTIEIAKAWALRNRPEMEAAHTWIERYFSSLSPDARKRGSQELRRALGDAVLQNARTFFSRKLPDTASCKRAVNWFSVPQLDIKNIPLNPGYEGFAEFPATLARIRAEPGFSVPKYVKLDFEEISKSSDGSGYLASLDAAEAARERGDTAGLIATFQSMAERGDTRAAQTVGLIYLNGQQIEKNDIEAYKWFHAAWVLGDAEGLNALGVMARDGLGVPVNRTLAGASFQLAKIFSKDQETFDRASGNLERLQSRMSIEEKTRVACMKLTDFEGSLRAPIQDVPPAVKDERNISSKWRVGDLMEKSTDVYNVDACR